MEFGLYAMRLELVAVKSDDLDYEQGIAFWKESWRLRSKRVKLLQKFIQMENFFWTSYRISKYVKINDGVQSLREIIEIIS